MNDMPLKAFQTKCGSGQEHNKNYAQAQCKNKNYHFFGCPLFHFYPPRFITGGKGVEFTNNSAKQSNVTSSAVFPLCRIIGDSPVE